MRKTMSLLVAVTTCLVSSAYPTDDPAVQGGWLLIFTFYQGSAQKPFSQFLFVSFLLQNQERFPLISRNQKKPEPWFQCRPLISQRFSKRATELKCGRTRKEQFPDPTDFIYNKVLDKECYDKRIRPHANGMATKVFTISLLLVFT